MSVKTHRLFFFWLLLTVVSLCFVSSCSISSGSESENNADTTKVTTKYLDIIYQKKSNISIRYFKNSIEVVLLANAKNDNYEFITIPFLVPPYDMFTTFIMQDYNYLRKNKKTEIYLDEFCDSTYWHLDNNNCYSMSNRFENGCINILCGNNGHYSYYSSYLTNDSILAPQDVKMYFRDRITNIDERNKLSEISRKQYLKSYIDSLNTSDISKFYSENFPIKFLIVDNDEHILTLLGDFEAQHNKNTINYDYFIDAVWFLTEQNPFLGLSLYYVDDNSFYPYNITLRNYNNETISEWPISILFNQRNFMCFWSRVRN